MLIPEFYEENDLEQYLVIYVCQKVAGIRKATAAYLASYFDTLGGFLRCTLDDLQNIRRADGETILRPEQAQAILVMREDYLPSVAADIRQLWIRTLIRDFIERALEDIQNINVGALHLNPFLSRAFTFTDPREAITFCFHLKILRALLVAWEATLEFSLLPNSTFIEDTVRVRNVIKQSSLNDLLHDLMDDSGEEPFDHSLRLLNWAFPYIADNCEFSNAVEAKRLSLIRDWEAKSEDGLDRVVEAKEPICRYTASLSETK